MTTTAFRLATLPFLFAATVSAQVATKPVVHHTAAAKHPIAATPVKPACPVVLPTLSPSIPALAKPDTCASSLYTLAYIDTEIGTGDLAAAHKFYSVHYTGYLPDGSKFDSSYDHPGAEPIVFPYGARQVIPGWDTGFEGMHVGGKRRLFIPYQLAYGEAGRPPIIPAKSPLIFDVVLVAQSDTAPAPKTAPATAATAKPTESARPADASKSAGSAGTSARGSSTSGTSAGGTPAARPATPPPTQSTTPDNTTKPAPPK